MEANKPVLILEHANSKLALNESQTGSSTNRYTLSGIFTEFNTVNRNNRIYTADKFLPHLESLNEKKNKLGVLYGEFDHPDTFDIAAQRISHSVESWKFNESSNLVEGQIKLLSTYWGKEAKAIIDDECPLFISSRAAGVTESNGTVALRQLFTYDIVADPGFASARMFKNNITESLGLNESHGAAIFDMSDTTSANGLYERNGNDVITKAMLEEYTEHLHNEINRLGAAIAAMAKTGAPEGVLENTVTELGNNQETLDKVNGHIEYLRKKNTILMSGFRKIDEANDALDKKIKAFETKLEKSIKFTEHVAENLKETAELTNNNVRFTEYVAQHTKENIEKTNESIEFIEYVADHTKANIDQSNFNADVNEGNMSYLDFIASKVDGIIDYQKMVSEKLNKKFAAKKINEADGDEEEEEDNFEDPVSYLNLEDDETGNNTEETSLEQDDLGAEAGDETALEEPQVPAEDTPEAPVDDNLPVEVPEGTEEVEGGYEYQPEQLVKVGDNTGTIIKVNTDGSVLIKVSGSDEEMESNPGEFELIDVDDDIDMNSEIPSIDTISNVIESAKNKKAANTLEPEFFMFMSSKQKKEFNGLSESVRAKVIRVMKESEYFSGNDVTRLIAGAMDSHLTTEEMLEAFMPEDVKPMWESFDETKKETVVGAAKIYNVSNRERVEAFCRTKIFEGKDEGVSTRDVVNSDKLSESALNAMFNELDRLDS